MLIHNFYSVKMQFESQLELQKHLWTTKELTAGNGKVHEFVLVLFFGSLRAERN